jgi:triacylglycerol esterase/lipase EstA (alpha/beta hydrolase family)
VSTTDFNTAKTSQDRSLIVLIPGWRRTARHLASLQRALLAALDDHDVRIFEYDTSCRSRQRLSTAADCLCTFISSTVEEKPYKSIVIIGHSIGGLVARQAYLCALGVTGTGVLPWASSITQLILLSTANRGSSFIDRNPVLRLLYSVVMHAVRPSPTPHTTIFWILSYPATFLF